MTWVVAIDPGTTESAYVVCRGDTVEAKGQVQNEDLLEWLRAAEPGEDKILAIEMVASYGMPVGKEVFETVLWAGRFIEAWAGEYEKIYRLDVKLNLCQDSRAKDANIRQAILDRYPRTGGGKTPQVGIKAQPGPLYGIANDMWAALGVALTCMDERSEGAP